MKKFIAILFVTFFSCASYGEETFFNNYNNEKCLSGNCRSKIKTAILKKSNENLDSNINNIEPKIKNYEYSHNSYKNYYKIRKFQSRRCR